MMRLSNSSLRVNALMTISRNHLKIIEKEEVRYTCIYPNYKMRTYKRKKLRQKHRNTDHRKETENNAILMATISVKKEYRNNKKRLSMAIIDACK